MSEAPDELRCALRLIVITDATMAAPRSVRDVVALAVSAGARAIQLRDKAASAGELLQEARALLEVTRPAGTLLLVNDRADVAVAAGADGVHLGPRDVPVSAIRGWAPRGFVIGYSTDDPAVAREAERAGADYIGCGAVYGTASKDVGGEIIGVRRLDEVARAVGIPVVGIGGVTVERAREVAASRAAGVAVIGAVMGAADPGGAVRGLLEPFEDRGP